MGLDAKTNKLTDYVLQNDLDFSRFTGIPYTENGKTHFDYTL